MRRIILVALLLSLMAMTATATETTVSGVARMDYNEATNKVSASQVRFNVFTQFASDTYSFVRIEPNEYSLDSENWLKLAFVTHKKLTIGRIPSLEGYTLPAPDQLYTVSWPRTPGWFYAYGMQWTENLSDSLSTAFEISGSPNGTATKNNWGLTGVTVRIAKNDATGWLAAIARYDDNRNSQVSISSEKTIGRTFVRTAVYSKSESNTTTPGGFIFCERRVARRIFLHAQTDWAKDSATVDTIGARLIFRKGFLTFDHEYERGDSRNLVGMIITF